MVIGYDAIWMLNDKGGLAHYGRLAIETLLKHYPQSDYILYTPTVSSKTSIINKLLVNNSVHVKMPRETMFKERWRTGSGVVRYMRRHGVKVFHGINGQLPKGIDKSSVASVVTIGSLAFKHFPNTYAWTERFRYNRNIKKAVRVANSIIVYSQFLKQEVVDNYNVDPKKISVVPPCCELHFQSNLSPQAVALLKTKYGLPERYMLISGGFDQRHNVKVAIQALQMLRSTGMQAVFVGHRNRSWEKLKALAEKLDVINRITRIPKVHEVDLSVLYSEAQVVVCPSLYEIASLSIIRAMTCGTPVVAATGSCMQEYGGDAARYFSPDSPEELAQAVKLAVGDDREAMIEAGYKQVEKFSPENSANALMEVYRQAIACKR